MEAAIRQAPTRATDAAPLVAGFMEVGRALNEVAHRANADETLPPDEDEIPAITRIYAFVNKAVS